jgi:hypothetical protein
LHANCGHCHNPTAAAFVDVDLDLRLRVSERSPESTGAYRSALGVPLERWVSPPFTVRVVAGAPDDSGLLARMRRRGNLDQMPPLATELVDLTLAAEVATWIQGLE